MAYYAKLNDENEVVRIEVISDKEADVAEKLKEAEGGEWVEVRKINGSIEAGRGDQYFPDKKAFRCPQPFASWSFNEDIWQWEPPVPKPTNDKPYFWNEGKGAWEEISDGD